ncbi:hypothetical protein A3B45_00220 [Candidatus Daviesbacteria bacterium RIFCSPLOWO2_01_FULL_39_12]|uniref:Methyltransferase type 11 domain-containing protein n=1 Tax=Candidatus Daviesbacteria bacterium RIFCSPLOWO2_01_FULL_39_12 TaxID=1797785 RepID=A0A1F5KP77_9BACT|nr:MAG: hypothetical protein A3B45_00220 [Candidatus Daviesbacteria bacterium RIFCSPLOWO2_01_FULL_39_12]
MNQAQQTLESMSQAVWYNQWTLKKFSSFLRGEILEVGCGIGNFTPFLTEYGKVWAIDIDRRYVNQTKRTLGDKAKVGYGDIERGEYFFKKKFDGIVCLNVLEHIQDDKKALKNLYKLLNPNGYLILLVPSHQYLFGEIDKSIGHFRRYSQKQLEDNLKKIGFKLIKSTILNFLGSIGWFIEGKLFKKRKIEEGRIKIFNFLAPFFLGIENLIEPPIGTSILVIAQRKL